MENKIIGITSNETVGYYNYEDDKYYAYVEASGKVGHYSKKEISKDSYPSDMFSSLNSGINEDEYDELTYDKSTHSYKIEDTDETEDMMVYFENKKLKKLTCKMKDENTGIYTPMEMTFTCGGQSIELPELIGDYEVDELKVNEIFNLTTQNNIKVEMVDVNNGTESNQQTMIKVDDKMYAPVGNLEYVYLDKSGDTYSLYSQSSGEWSKETTTQENYEGMKSSYFDYSTYYIALVEMKYYEDKKEYRGQNIELPNVTTK